MSSPSKFVVVQPGQGYCVTAPTDAAALTKAKSVLNERYHAPRTVGVYRLVKVIRRKEAPIDVEEVACCDEKVEEPVIKPATKKKGKK